MSIYYDGFNEKCLTFKCTEDCEMGFVKFDDNGYIANCENTNREDFIGYCKSVRDGLATVQLEGYVETFYEGDATLGFNSIMAGVNDVKAIDSQSSDDEEMSSVRYRVIMVDTTNNKIGFIL